MPRLTGRLRVIRRLRRWPIVAGIVVVVLAGGAVTAWAVTRSSGSSSNTQTVAAAVNTISSTVASSGTIAPAHEADLDFGASGRVTKVFVKAGSTVKKGQRLATITKASLRATKDAAVATETAASDKVADDSGVTSAQADSDKAALTAAKSAAHSAKVALRDATLRSTISGTVTSIDLTVGQQVSSGSTSGSGSGSGAGSGSGGSSAAASSSTSSQVVVQSSDSFIVNATVDDTEVSEVAKGQAVAVTPSGANAPVDGTVTSVSSVPSSTSGVVSFPIVIALTGHPTGVYADASATVTITLKKSIRALEIPTLAITYNGSQASVKVNNGHGISTRNITVGTAYGLETQVLSGIKAGDKVVVTIPTFGRGGTNRRGGTGGTGGFGGGFGGGTGGTGGFGGGTGGFGGGTGGFGGGTGGFGGGGFGGGTGTGGG